MRQAAGERASEGFQVCETDCPPRIGGQRDREADPARGGSCMKGNFWIWLPLRRPSRDGPPLLFQEGSRNLKLDHDLKMQLLRGSIKMRPHRYLQEPFRVIERAY